MLVIAADSLDGWSLLILGGAELCQRERESDTIDRIRHLSPPSQADASIQILGQCEVTIN